MNSNRIIIAVIMLLTFAFSSTVFSQSMFLQNEQSGILLGGGIEFRESAQAYEVFASYSLASVLDISAFIGDLNAGNADYSDGNYMGFGLMAHLLRSGANLSYSIAPMFSHSKINYDAISDDQVTDTYGGFLYIRSNSLRSRFFLVGVGITNSKSSLEVGGDKFSEEEMGFTIDFNSPLSGLPISLRSAASQRDFWAGKMRILHDTRRFPSSAWKPGN